MTGIPSAVAGTSPCSAPAALLDAPRGYGFTIAQLDVVTSWYQAIYQVTPDSIIVTSLPAAYNFTFVAGVLLAARLGARLHLSAGHHRVLDDAARLARSADRLIVLANPVILDQATPTGRLPADVLVDSGGAPLSITGISDFRAHGIDVREGYGLTETASLTHFDTEATAASLGTVGTAMPGMHATITRRDGKPVIELSGPATGIPLDPSEPLPARSLRTTDLGASDGTADCGCSAGRRRADQRPVAPRHPRRPRPPPGTPVRTRPPSCRSSADPPAEESEPGDPHSPAMPRRGPARNSHCGRWMSATTDPSRCCTQQS